MEKVIVYISHDRHREDIIKVYKYSEKNLAKVEQSMKDRWNGENGHKGYFGDLPSENGYQYGYCEEYYDSYSIAEIEKEVIK